MELICKNCRYFRQHTVKFGRRYDEIYYGHCAYPRLKNGSVSPKRVNISRAENNPRLEIRCFPIGGYRCL